MRRHRRNASSDTPAHISGTTVQVERVRRLLGQEVAECLGLDGVPQIDHAVDEARGNADVAGSAEIHAGGAAQHAVHADDRHDDHDVDPAHQRRGLQHGGAHQSADGDSVQDGDRGSAARLEQTVGHDAGHHSAQDAGAAQHGAPVVIDERAALVGLFEEDVGPLHDAAPHHSAHHLDTGDGHDDGVSQHLAEHREGTQPWAIVIRRRVADVEVGVAGVARAVAYQAVVDEGEAGQDRGRNVEQELERQRSTGSGGPSHRRSRCRGR